MVSRSIILSVMVAVFTLQGVLAQSSSTANFSEAIAPTTTLDHLEILPSTATTNPPMPSGSVLAGNSSISTPVSTSETPTTALASAQTNTTPASTATTNPAMTATPSSTTATINHTTSSQTASSTTPTGSSSVAATPEPATTPPPSAKTCGNIDIELKTQWQESYTNSSSNFHMELIVSLRGFFSDSTKYRAVVVSDLTLKQKEGDAEKVILNAKLCMVVISDYIGLIQDKIAKEGKIGNAAVVEGSLKFTALGVEFSAYEAKEGECKKCSEGGGGPIVIERKCTAKTGYSCKGVKNTKETEDCVTYCGSSAVARVSTLIFALAVLLSFSFNIWE